MSVLNLVERNAREDVELDLWVVVDPLHIGRNGRHAHVPGAAEDAAGHDAVILLSPACASFDQFASFEERGRAFCRIAAAQPGTQRDVRHNGEAA